LIAPLLQRQPPDEEDVNDAMGLEDELAEMEAERKEASSE
jgi:hypothetical protein